MRTTCDLRHDGPYLHLTLPDLVPTDWGHVERAVEDELEEGVARAFVRVPAARWGAEQGRIATFVRGLRQRGVGVDVIRMPDPFAEMYVG